jgi:hypothetical protein
VEQVFVFSSNEELAAVVVPDAEALLAWAREHDLPQVRVCVFAVLHRCVDAGLLCWAWNQWVATAAWRMQDVPRLCRSYTATQVVAASMAAAAAEAGCQPVAAIALVAEPFTVANGLLASTHDPPNQGHVCRRAVQQRYQPQLAALREALEALAADVEGLAGLLDA